MDSQSSTDYFFGQEDQASTRDKAARGGGGWQWWGIWPSFFKDGPHRLYPDGLLARAQHFFDHGSAVHQRSA
jgi:hypothetical protein